MTADAHFSPSIPSRLTRPHLVTVRLVQHVTAISATAELSFNKSSDVAEMVWQCGTSALFSIEHI